MTIFMYGLGAAIVAMIVGISWAVAKDVKDLINYVYEPNNGPLHR